MSCCAFANASSLLNDCLKASFLASISGVRVSWRQYNTKYTDQWKG